MSRSKFLFLHEIYQHLFNGVFDITFVANVVLMPPKDTFKCFDMISEVHMYYLFNLKGSSAIHG